MMKDHLIIKIFFVILLSNGVFLQECNKLYFDSDSFVCVCSEASCDFIGQIVPPNPGSYIRIVSSRDEHRFNEFSGILETQQTGNISVIVNLDYSYQSIIGFGGAFTDATGINVLSLSENLQEALLRSYFAPEGIEYNVCRIPIAGTDFSTYPYSYDEVEGDVDLQFFALTQEDFLYKIPLIQKAIELSPQEIKLFGSTWSPPPWMKENGMHNGSGGLLREMWDPYSQYLVKFVQAYESHNLTIWGLTPQNEPNTGFTDYEWNTCAWSAEDMRDWIKTSFGPIFESVNLRRVLLMILDETRNYLPSYPATILEDPEANQYVDGTAIHWYEDAMNAPELLTEIATEFPDKFLLYTESCAGFNSSLDQRVILASWQRAENYAANIIEDLNHFVTGWVDWNLALDLQGGPNWVNNFVDSPIIVNTDEGVFYKQPMFYAMGHFSKFIHRGSTRVYTSVGNDLEVRSVAFHEPEGLVTVIVLNTGEAAKQISIVLGDNYVNFELSPKSLETILLAQ